MSESKKNSVLIVDDESMSLNVLVNILSPDYVIYPSKSGLKAIELAEKYSPDLILLDILMPDMNGYEVLERLKKSPKTHNIPVIFITGLTSDEDEEKGLALDAADFIPKPFSYTNVKLRVRNQLQIVNQTRAREEYAHNLYLTLNKLEAIVNNYKGVIWSVDNNGIITSFNGQYLKNIGIDSSAIIGKDVEAARRKDRHIDLIDSIEKTFKEGAQDWTSEIDGKIFRSHTIPMYNNSGSMIGIVGSSDDVTELVELHAAIAAAEEKSNFFAKMSHEMRTPLNAVIGLSDVVLEEGGISNEAKENIEKISNSGTSLLCLVNDILDISKMDAGKFELVPVEYETSGMISDAVTQSVMRKGEKPIEFIINIDNNIPIRLFGDDQRINQVLINVLSNAFKYTMEGSVELHVKCEPYETPDAPDTEKKVLLIMYVKDTGIGIKDENINLLFSDYSQMDTKTNRKIEGTGLGLSITKTIVDMMGGKISVESEYGKGSTFTVKIPQKLVDDHVIPAEIINNLKNFNYHVRNRKIKARLSRIMPYAHVLVVDDVITNLDVAKGMMKPYKMQIDCLDRGEKAVEAVREEKVKYNAIFMDHMMPGIDGIEATRIIREEIGTEYAKTVPIIALTANALKGNEEMFLSKGFNAFITKPIDIPRLDAVINQWVRNEEQEKEYEAKHVTIEGETFFDDRNGTDRRSGKDRRKGYDRRAMLNANIEGMDMHKGLERFGGDMETFLQILKSFTVNTPALIDTMRDVNKENLPQYAINVHGIKSSCRGISAEVTGSQAEALEKAAKAGDLDFVTANNPPFLEAAMKLVNDIGAVINKGEEKTDKPKKEKPYNEALSKLYDACDNFKLDEAEAVMKEIEVFDYTDDDGLVLWLRENVNQMNFIDITEKLSGLTNSK